MGIPSQYTSDACISAINSYYHQVLSYGRERRVILDAPIHDQDCLLANLLAAHFLCSTDPSRAPFHFQAAKSRLEQATSYEKAVFDAINSLISENRDDDVAVECHAKLLNDYPKDLVSLKRAQLLCFYMGRPDLSLGLVQQVLSTSSENLRLTHNWWHVALCYLEGHASMQKVLGVYDHHIWKELEGDDATSPEVYLNALGLLLRVYVRDTLDVFEDRMKVLADRVKDEANWHLEWHLDLLILWALAKTGELSKAEDLLKGLKSRICSMNKKKQQRMQRGMLLAEALYEYGRGNNKKALEVLGPDFDANDCKMIGASDEQLEVFNEVWYDMLLNAGQATKAIEVIEKRIKKRRSPFHVAPAGNGSDMNILERGYAMTGRQEAQVAGEKARALESAYFI
ncbi:hypothetical protein GH714_036314 [Hevea brasiliensis]|uniref:Tetratricopeptide repeat protein 38 n=1 Tax=Hevea brasiliensis TaxID=3981 RepID=A0A6A6LLV3_HEVBR|nr:hypothetical protein GH714_036314 [Hevea brasiliensis]